MDNEVVFDQVDRHSLVASVLLRITDGIVAGRLKPGDRIVEEWMAEQLGVSRNPVRDALHRLEQMGLVVKVPYRGSFVATLAAEDIQELHVDRSPLEGLAAEILAEQRDPAALARLEAILAEMRQAAAAGDQAKIVDLDVDFHDALIHLTGNKLLREVWSTVSLKLRRFILLKRQRMYATLDEAVAIHQAILEAITSGSADRAATEVRSHIDQAGRVAGLTPGVSA